MSRDTLKERATEIAERLSPMGPLDTRPLFGAIGIRLDGVTFCFVHGEHVFLKCDEATIAAFEPLGSVPFSYEGPNGTIVAKTTWSVPASVLDDQDTFLKWARHGFAIAHAAKAARKPRKRQA